MAILAGIMGLLVATLPASPPARSQPSQWRLSGECASASFTGMNIVGRHVVTKREGYTCNSAILYVQDQHYSALAVIFADTVSRKGKLIAFEGRGVTYNRFVIDRIYFDDGPRLPSSGECHLEIISGSAIHSIVCSARTTDESGSKIVGVGFTARRTDRF